MDTNGTPFTLTPKLAVAYICVTENNMRYGGILFLPKYE